LFDHTHSTAGNGDDGRDALVTFENLPRLFDHTHSKAGNGDDGRDALVTVENLPH
jgi:hypothetical protein